MMSDVDIKKLKVTELREELKKHGLDTKGKKEQLVKRLENFLAGAAGNVMYLYCINVMINKIVFDLRYLKREDLSRFSHDAPAIAFAI